MHSGGSLAKIGTLPCFLGGYEYCFRARLGKGDLVAGRCCCYSVLFTFFFVAGNTMVLRPLRSFHSDIYVLALLCLSTSSDGPQNCCSSKLGIGFWFGYTQRIPKYPKNTQAPREYPRTRRKPNGLGIPKKYPPQSAYILSVTSGCTPRYRLQTRQYRT